MSDRWLFLLALGICGLIVYSVGRIALDQIKALLEDLKVERTSREAYVEKVNRNFLELIARLEKQAQRANDVIENNTQAMREVAKEVAFIRQKTTRTEQ